MKTLTLSIAGLAIVLLAVPAMGQTITFGTGTLQNTTYTWPTAYGNWYSGSRDQFLFQASELAAAGMPAANIASVAWDVVTPGGQALQLFEIKMGLTTVPDLSTGWVSTAWTTVYGPTTYQDVVGWNTHTFAAPFAWDGASNIVMEICFWDGASNYTTNGVVNQTATPFASVRNAHSDLAPSCGGTSVGTSYSQRPNTRFGFGAPPPAEYQVNQPGSSLDIDGLQGTVTSPAVAAKCLNSVGVANFASNLPGSLWEAALALAPLVPTSNGGIPLPGPQVLNVNFASPTLFYLWGGPVPALVPFFGNFSGAFNTGPVPGTVSIQQIHIHPSLPVGFALSQGCQVNIGGGSVLGPVGDDTYSTITLAGSPLCAPGPVMMYGTAYTQIHVGTNGRVMFGSGDSSCCPYAPIPTTGPAYAGVWCDLNVLPGSSVVVDMMNPTTLRVAYNAVPYYYNTGTNTFDIQFGLSTGTVTLNGLAGIGVNSSNQVVGMSPGTAATDPGAVTYFPPTTGFTTNATAMIYAYGTEGSLTAGLSQIVFFPNAYSNYDWISY